MKKALLISGCLLGLACRYDGAEKPLAGTTLDRLMETYQLIPCCPEQLGGLATPRPPAERRGAGVFTQAGGDVTTQYRRGAAQALALARRFGCTLALLKQRSPACGSGQVYDGSFTGALVPGDGVAAELLRAHGVTVYGEDQAEALLIGLDFPPRLP